MVVFGLLDKLGIGLGSMDLTLEKQNYKMGEPIRGRVVLKLNKPLAARELRVVLESVEKTPVTEHSSRGTTTEWRTYTARRSELKIDGEKEYPKGQQEYQFELPTPAPAGSGAGGGIDGAIGAMGAVLNSMRRLEWFVVGALDIPGGADVGKRVRVNLL